MNIQLPLLKSYIGYVIVMKQIPSNNGARVTLVTEESFLNSTLLAQWLCLGYSMVEFFLNTSFWSSSNLTHQSVLYILIFSAFWAVCVFIVIIDGLFCLFSMPLRCYQTPLCFRNYLKKPPPKAKINNNKIINYKKSSQIFTLFCLAALIEQPNKHKRLRKNKIWAFSLK